MRLTLLLSPLLLLACNQPETLTPDAPAGLHAAGVAASGPASVPPDDAAMPSDTQMGQNALKLGVAMTAMTELCGVAKPGEVEKALVFRSSTCAPMT